MRRPPRSPAARPGRWSRWRSWPSCARASRPAVFLLATFQASGNALTAGIGALLGVLVAVGLGFGIFRGGVRLNMARFFTLTSVVLVVVAAGLVMTAVHTAHEAGWVTFGQTQAADLSWLVRPGTPVAALLTGVLGIQPQPVVVEVVAWALYVVPMLVFVLRPPARPATPRPVAASTVRSTASATYRRRSPPSSVTDDD